MQTIIENGTTVLLADEGMVLTDNSSFGKTVRLGKSDDGAGWHEITEAEAAERMATDVPAGDEATAADYEAALREMGVAV